MNRDFYNDLEIAWNVSKFALQGSMDAQLFKSIEKFMLEIEQELQK